VGWTRRERVITYEEAVSGDAGEGGAGERELPEVADDHDGHHLHDALQHAAGHDRPGEPHQPRQGPAAASAGHPPPGAEAHGTPHLLTLDDGSYGKRGAGGQRLVPPSVGRASCRVDWVCVQIGGRRVRVRRRLLFR
jgi:hypothetical protein